MWIFIWVVLSLFVIGVFLWSVVILREQKTSWAAFAKKNRLEYKSGKFMESATVRGNYQGFRLSLYSDTQQTEDVRGERYVSVIEFELGTGMNTGAAMGTKEMAPFVATLSFNQTVPVQQEKWKPDYIVKTRDAAILSDYLIPPRLTALADIFAMNKVSALFFFDEQDCVLHLETVDPLRRADKLERIMTRLIALVRVLALPEMLPENRKALNAPLKVMEQATHDPALQLPPPDHAVAIDTESPAEPTIALLQPAPPVQDPPPEQ